ncbi:pseudouridine synthase, partial [Acuticoccus yangtzensis]
MNESLTMSNPSSPIAADGDTPEITDDTATGAATPAATTAATDASVVDAAAPGTTAHATAADDIDLDDLGDDIPPSTFDAAAIESAEPAADGLTDEDDAPGASAPVHTLGAAEEDETARDEAAATPARTATPARAAAPTGSDTDAHAEDDTPEDDTPKGDRIAKVIARAGVASRRDAEAMILEGRVSLNGTVLDSPAVNVTEADTIRIDGEVLPQRLRTRLFLFHKPRGLVTTNHDPEGRPTVFEALPSKLPRVVTVGRLDINTEGLLLLTNDGGLARVLELPATGWTRKYRARVHGPLDKEALSALAKGTAVDGVLYGPIHVTVDRDSTDNAWLTVALSEGKNREVKIVLGSLGLQVSRLIRISYGPFQLGEIPRGEVVEVPTRQLKDQLGPRLAAEAEADFESPVAAAPVRKPKGARGAPAERGGARPAGRDAGRFGDRDGGRRDGGRDAGRDAGRDGGRDRGGRFGDRDGRDGARKGPGPRRDARVLDERGSRAYDDFRQSRSDDAGDRGYGRRDEGGRGRDGERFTGNDAPWSTKTRDDRGGFKSRSDDRGAPRRPYGDRDDGGRPDRGGFKPRSDDRGAPRRPYGDRDEGARPDRGGFKSRSDDRGAPRRPYGDRDDG